MARQAPPMTLATSSLRIPMPRGSMPLSASATGHCSKAATGSPSPPDCATAPATAWWPASSGISQSPASQATSSKTAAMARSRMPLRWPPPSPVQAQAASPQAHRVPAEPAIPTKSPSAASTAMPSMTPSSPDTITTRSASSWAAATELSQHPRRTPPPPIHSASPSPTTTETASRTWP